MKLKSIYTLVILFFCLSFKGSSQSESGSLSDFLNVILEEIPGESSFEYEEPTENDVTDWEVLIKEILVGDISTSRTLAEELNYEIVEYSDTDQNPSKLSYILVEQKPNLNYWGTYVFNAFACRSGLILQAPHPKKDLNTGKQAIYCYTKLSARSLFLSGTDRCNHFKSSGCDGLTTACSDVSEPYPISDMAHNSGSIFQATTKVVFNQVGESVFVQLHGFTKQSADPDIIMSNGTKEVPSGNDFALQLKDGLSMAENSLTFEVGHTNSSWIRLLGTTNTQGRLINESLDPCDQPAISATGRFIHLEQEKEKLRIDEQSWDILREALENTFSCTSVNVDNHILAKTNFAIYPNPSFSRQVVLTDSAFEKIQVFDTNGISVFAQDLKVTETLIDLEGLHAGIYFVHLYKPGKAFLQKLILL